MSSARTRLPQPSSLMRSIQFLKTRRPEKPSFAAAQLMTTDCTRSGYLPATIVATIPPIDVPWMWALSIPSASSMPIASSAQSSRS